MDPDFAQRRRVAVAIAITVIAVPAAVLLNRGDDATDAAPAPTLIDAPATAPRDGSQPGPVATDAMGTAVIGTEAGLDEPVIDEPARIAIPRLPDGIDGTASFRSDIIDATLCHVPDAPFNAQVTVTNLDNSRSVRCFAAVGGARPDTDVVMHRDAFLRIADITDAPVPVRITW